MKRNSIVIAVYLILVNQGMTLYIKRQNTGWNDGKYALPAGHVEKDESALDALYREIKEEIGIKPINPRLVHVVSRNANDCNRLDLFFIAEKWKGTIRNLEKKKCSEIVWSKKMPKDLIDITKDAMAKISKEIPYSENGWDKFKT